MLILGSIMFLIIQMIMDSEMSQGTGQLTTHCLSVRADFFCRFCTCADPSGYFWYSKSSTFAQLVIPQLLYSIDSGHPTQRVHQLLAGAVQDQLFGI